MTTTLDQTPEQETDSGSIEVHRLTAFIGAELRNVSLADAANDPAVFAQIKDLLLQHKVLFFRNQDISRADHVKLAERFGPLEDHPALGCDPDHPGLVRIYKDLDSPAEQYENAFHCDATWREAPPMGSVLRCVEGPAVGGDTIWVNMVKAYERLPEHVKEQIADLRARHSIEASFGANMPIEQRLALHERFPDAEHPVVRTHPETGEKVLFVNAFTTHFTNFHNAKNVRFGFDYTPGGSELLNYLIRQAFVPEYQVRWRWTPNSFAIWDNRCTQHYAVQDYFPAVRRMERAGIVGDKTF
jgi:taurine dioxygenase